MTPPCSVSARWFARRGREWAVQPGSDSWFLILRPLGAPTKTTPESSPHWNRRVSILRIPDTWMTSATTPPLECCATHYASVRSVPRLVHHWFRWLSMVTLQTNVPPLMALRQTPCAYSSQTMSESERQRSVGLIALNCSPPGSQTAVSVVFARAGRTVAIKLRNKFGLNVEYCCHRQQGRLQRTRMGESVFDRYPVTRRLDRLHQIKPGWTSSFLVAP